jgi:N-ethylmaleimide reductase
MAVFGEPMDADPSRRMLFSPIRLGPYDLRHRVVLAPLTRLRSHQPGDVPGPMMVDYYTQRASEGGFMVTEATTIATTGRGYLGAPGIYSDEQVDGWLKVTDAVHAKGAHIFQQLWHVGRTSHVDMTGGVAPVGPSVVPYEGVAFTKNGWVPVSPSRALLREELPIIIDQYRNAAVRAEQAGFDGVELHSANGYLLDQFLQNGANHRTDDYGGSFENRARLLLQAVDVVVEVWGANRVAVRLSPSTPFNGISDSDPTPLFDYVASELNRRKLAYLHLIEPRINGNAEVAKGLAPVAAIQLRKFFTGLIIAAGGFDAHSAEAIIQRGDADLVAFGRYFISNPDLPKRFALNLPLNEYDRSTFYGGDAHGYTDYPIYQSTPQPQLS